MAHDHPARSPLPNVVPPSCDSSTTEAPVKCQETPNLANQSSDDGPNVASAGSASDDAHDVLPDLVWLACKELGRVFEKTDCVPLPEVSMRESAQ